MKFPPISDMASAIVAAHAATLALPVHVPNVSPLPPDSLPTATHALTTKVSSADIHDGKGPVYAAAYQACLALGFIATDAHCVSNVWQNQAARDGFFDAAKWPALPQDFALECWPRANAFPPCPKSLGLYAVLPDANWVARMAQAGVPTLQLRFKSDNQADIVREVRLAVEAVKGTNSLLFINDHWQTAIDAGAYGVHLGQEDLEIADLAAIRQSGLRLGLSSHGYVEMIKADRASPSYIAMGAVYATTLKRMVTPPQGPGRLAVYARLMRDYPLVAIGGIDEARFDEVLPSGVGSIAVVRAIVAADDPQAAAKRLMRKMRPQSTL